MKNVCISAFLAVIFTTVPVVVGASTSPDKITQPVPVVVHVVGCRPNQIIDLDATQNSVYVALIGTLKLGELNDVPFTVSPRAGSVADLNFALVPGSYELFINLRDRNSKLPGPFSNMMESNFVFTVLPAQPRHLTTVLCNSITLIDSHRTVSGLLPTPGLDVALVSSAGVEPVGVDGVGYYASSVRDGPLWLRVYLDGSRQYFCDFLVPESERAGPESSYQSLRYDFDWTSLASPPKSTSCRLHT